MNEIETSQYYVHVTIPPIPKPVMLEDSGRQVEEKEEKIFGLASFLEIQDEYLFWEPSLLRYFPQIERWASADARQFEKSMMYRLRYLVQIVYGASPGQAPLQKLEIEWIWDEITRRELGPDALRMIEQAGVDQKLFLRDREKFRPVPMSPWPSMRRLAQIVSVFFAIGWGVYVTYWLIRLEVVTELWIRLLSLIK
ncbi:MAG: hypothetical protein HYV97_01980 [Bdellovibrio sp.]|nr:hypothetical protein [Bdellovibrio sp.]